MGKVHPAVPELLEQYRQGRITRREFIRYACLLGLSLASAELMSSCKPAKTPTPQPTQAPVATAKPTAAPTTVAQATATPQPTAAPVQQVKRGGRLVVNAGILRMEDPARASETTAPNYMRPLCEYLTFTNEKNITVPFLLEKWEPSEDLKVWTLVLRKDVTFNNGDRLTADDVVFCFKHWLTKETGSSLYGLMSYLKKDNVEKVDDFTIKLHLDSPQIAVPEHLFHYSAAIMNHRTFEGDIIKKPVGTGPFELAEYVPEERVVWKKRTQVPYWRRGVDGKPLPYLDEIVFLPIGGDAAIPAFQASEFDIWSIASRETALAFKDDANVVLTTCPTGQCDVIRMKVDEKPWDNVKVRQALKLCLDRETILKTVYQGFGAIGHDHHVSPVHPEYCDIGVYPYDPKKAKALLAEAGYPDGIKAEIVCDPYLVPLAEQIQQSAAPGGFELKVTPMPNYWDVWTKVPLGITNWAHRPLGTMVLRLAYTCDAEGKPVPWNETFWCDNEFNLLLNQAEGTVDVEKRRRIMCQLEKIQQERGSIAITVFEARFGLCQKYVKGYGGAHPGAAFYVNDVWLDK